MGAVPSVGSAQPIRELPSLKTETLNRTLFSRIESKIVGRGVDMKGTLLRHHQHYLGDTSPSASENIMGRISHRALMLLAPALTGLTESFP